MFKVSHMQTLLLFTSLYFIATTNKRKLPPKIASLPPIFLFPYSPVVSKACHSLYCSSLHVSWRRTRRYLTENPCIAEVYLKTFTSLPNMKKMSLFRYRFKHSTLFIQSENTWKQNIAVKKKGIIIKRFRL